jgi:ferredoxin
MPRQIDQDRCIQCGACLDVCPNDGISEQDGEIRIDSRLCTECFGFAEKSQCVEVCPVEAIGECEEVVLSEDDLVGISADLHPERFPRG